MDPIPIFMATDDNYAGLCTVTATSVCENTSSQIYFYIISNNLSQSNRTKIISSMNKYHHAHIEFLDINADDIFKHFNTWEHVSITGFARLLIPWLKPQIHKAIYLDVDTICLQNIATLYNTELGKFPIAAAECIEVANDLIFKETVRNTLNLSSTHVYFNSGVLVIDCEKLRKDPELPHGFFEIENKYPEHPCADQDILNKYFENNYKQLDQKYNVTICDVTNFKDETQYKNTMNDIVIRHFVGRAKAHNSLYGMSVKHMKSYNTFWQYASKTDFFGELLAGLIRSNIQPHKNRYWIKIFGVIPLIKIKHRRVYLFGLIPILTIE